MTPHRARVATMTPAVVLAALDRPARESDAMTPHRARVATSTPAVVLAALDRPARESDAMSRAARGSGP